MGPRPRLPGPEARPDGIDTPSAAWAHVVAPLQDEALPARAATVPSRADRDRLEALLRDPLPPAWHALFDEFLLALGRTADADACAGFLPGVAVGARPQD